MDAIRTGTERGFVTVDCCRILRRSIGVLTSLSKWTRAESAAVVLTGYVAQSELDVDPTHELTTPLMQPAARKVCNGASMPPCGRKYSIDALNEANTTPFTHETPA
jgi:hypothetical protein